MAPVLALRSGPAGEDADLLGGIVRGPSVSDAVGMYLSGRLDRGELSPYTAAKVGVTLRQFAEQSGDPAVRKLSGDHVRAWQAGQAHLRPSTRGTRWSQVKVFLSWCVDEELVARHPMRRLKAPRPPRRLPRPLSREQVGAVLAAAVRVDGLRGRLIVLLMVQLGLRAGGVAALRVEDVEGRWLRPSEKGGHERELWVTEECWEALVAYLEAFPVSSGPLVRRWRPSGGVMGREGLVASDRGVSAQTVSKLMARFMYEAGVKERAWDGRSGHALRHTCATDMLEGGADITEVQVTLGHASVSTSMIYTLVRAERVARAMEGRRYGEPGLEVVA